MFLLCGRIDTCSVPHATQRNAGTRRTPHVALRRALPTHIRALCDTSSSAYRHPRVYMYAGHIDTQFDTHRLHNRPISRRIGLGVGAEANHLQRSDLTDYDPDEKLDRRLYLSLITEFRIFTIIRNLIFTRNHVSH